MTRSEKKRALDKKYYEKNRERIKARVLKYQSENHDRYIRYQREYREKNLEVLKRKGKEYYHNNKEKYLKKTYGITLDDYESMMVLQEEKCAICGYRFEGSGSERLSPVVDHDHETGKIRGIIHNVCNRYLMGGIESASRQTGESVVEISRLVTKYLEGCDEQ